MADKSFKEKAPEKMKVAHLVSTFPPYRGGIGNAAFNYAKELSRLGYDVEVFTPNYDGSSRRINEEIRFKVHWMRSWLKYGNGALTPQLLWKLSSFDLVHIHYPFFGGAEWVIFFKMTFVHPPKIVLSYHMDVIGEGFLKHFFKGYRKGIFPSLIRQVDSIIVSTRDYADTGQISPFLKGYPVYEIPYGVSTVFHPQEKNKNLLNRLNIAPDSPIVLFVGGLDRAHYFKGVPFLIEAIAKLKRKEVKLLIVGNGELIQNYQAQVKRESIQNQVVFITGVSDQELPDYYNLSDLVVLPSINRSEAFGLVLLEAMACGKPVIGSSLPGIRTIIEEDENGLLVQPGDSNDLMEKIKYLIDHKEIGEQYGLSGLRKVEEKYQWGHIIRQVEKVYREVTGH